MNKIEVAINYSPTAKFFFDTFVNQCIWLLEKTKPEKG